LDTASTQALGRQRNSAQTPQRQSNEKYKRERKGYTHRDGTSATSAGVWTVFPVVKLKTTPMYIDL